MNEKSKALENKLEKDMESTAIDMEVAREAAKLHAMLVQRRGEDGGTAVVTKRKR